MANLGRSADNHVYTDGCGTVIGKCNQTGCADYIDDDASRWRYCDSTGYADRNLTCTCWSDDTALHEVQPGTWATAMGFDNKACGIASTAMGRKTTTSGCSSTAMGFCTKASGNYSTAMGFYTKASGCHSTAMGYNSTTSGSISVAMGYNSRALGDASTAMGYDSEASGCAAVVMGKRTEASGDHSTAMGFCSRALECASTAMGFYTKASGNYSTAMGYKATASASVSTAMGYCTVASGTASTAMGYCTAASGTASVVMGYGNCTSSEKSDSVYAHAYELVLGCKDNNIRLEMDTGNGYFDGSADAGDADYAEYFEHVSDNCLCRGYFTSYKDGECKICAGNNDIIGIVSSNPAVLGDSDALKWKGKYLLDDFGRRLRGPREYKENIDIKVDQNDLEFIDGSIDNQKVLEYVLDNKDTYIQSELEFIDYFIEDGSVEYKDGNEETVLINTNITGIYMDDGLLLNPDFDETVEHLPRSSRPEWSPIGLLGKLWVYKSDEGDEYNVGDWVTSDEDGKAVITTRDDSLGAWRIIEVKEDIVRVLFR